jgi:hypothetical protein
MNRVFKDVFDLEDDSDLHKACRHDKVVSLDSLISFSPAEIDDLTFKEGTKEVKLAKGFKGFIFVFQALVIKRASESNKFENDWSDANKLEYDEYRVSPEYMSSRTGIANPNAPKPPPTVSTFVRPRDPLADFRRGTRRDPNAFIPLKEDKQWDSWQRSTIAQARAQDLSDVLDPLFVPTTPDDIELFIERQKFMYAVFEKNLLTDKGKALVRLYGSTFDAQQVYKDISAYAKSSTMASMEASNLLTYITSARLGDGTWKGKAHGFILHWQDQIRQYELILPTSDHLSSSMKRTMLENAVAKVPELRAVKNQAAQHKTQNGGIDLSYEQYCALLASAAQDYDGSLTRDIKPMPSAARRSVYLTDIEPRQEYLDDDDAYFDTNTYSIDSNHHDIIEANVHGFGGPRLNADQWSRLPRVLSPLVTWRYGWKFALDKCRLVSSGMQTSSRRVMSPRLK